MACWPRPCNTTSSSTTFTKTQSRSNLFFMDIRTLQQAVVDALEDVKAQDIKVFDTSGQTSLFDRVVIASGTSNRQTRALASSVEDKALELGVRPIAREGDETGEWVLVDLGYIVVHVM